MILPIVAFSVMFALADRICGGPRIIPPIKLGKVQFSIINDVWVPFALMGGTWQLTENVWTTLTLPLAFAIWRGPGWKTFGGDLAPTTPEQVSGTFLRHLLAMPLTAAIWPSTAPAIALAVPLAFALIAGTLAWWCGLEVSKGRNRTEAVEWLRGGSLGLLIGLVVI